MITNFSQCNDATAVSYRFLYVELVREEASQAKMYKSSSYSLILITEGCGTIMLESGGARLQRDICLLLAPGMSCQLEIGVEGMVFYQVCFEVIKGMNVAGQSTFDQMLSQTTLTTCNSFSTCMLLVESLYRHQQECSDLEQLENQIRFQSLLLSILKQFRQAGGDEHDLRQEVLRSVEYVREHYDESFTIEQLAAMTDTSRKRYTEIFKEVTGQIPIDFLNNVRIDKAQQLLLLTEDKLNGIAQAVGYSNEYYFNRKFKQMVGVTPGQYRRQFQTSMRIFAPFLEDYLLALGMKPVMQYSHALWGRQEYLGMCEVPDFDVSVGNWADLERHKPELILLDDGYRRWSLDLGSRISPVFKLPYSGEDWQVMLQSLGAILGRKEQAALAIESYENKVAGARERLARTVRDETVAVLRISAKAIYLYGGETRGYTGPLLYSGLKLAQPALVYRLAKNERRINLTLDSLAQLDADHIFVTFDKADGEGAGRELLHSSVWNCLPAVKGGRVYEVDFLSWMNYGVLSHSRKIDDILATLG